MIFIFCVLSVIFFTSAFALDPTEQKSPPQLAINRDPTRPFTYKKADFTLKGIIYNDEQKYCMINGRYLSEGDIVSGYKITSVTSNEVMLERGKEKIVLKI